MKPRHGAADPCAPQRNVRRLQVTKTDTKTDLEAVEMPLQLQLQRPSYSCIAFCIVQGRGK